MRACRGLLIRVVRLAVTVLLPLVPGLPRAAQGQAREAGAKPNVLLITLDDANTEMGVYGHPVVRTPNLERLAARGVVFRSAYCQYPLCNPSRIAMFTSLRPTTTGYYLNERPFRDPTLMGIPILPRHLKVNGYATAGSGKVAHGSYYEPSSWTESHAYGYDPAPPALPPHPAPQDGSRVIYGGPYMNGPDGTLGRLLDTKHVDSAIEMLGRLPEPFFLAVGLQHTHVPWLYPESFLTYYDPQTDVPPRPLEEQSNAWRQGVYWRAWESYTYLDPAWAAQPDGGRSTATVNYWRTLTYDDAEIGRLLDALDRASLTDRTIIIVVSDNGWSSGYHGRWFKLALFDWCARVPMIVSVPWLAGGHGRACARPVEMIDLYPTIVDLCGLPAPEGMEGLSLRSLLDNPDAPALKPAFSVLKPYDMNWVSLMVRSDRFKFVYWPNGMHQLYDMQADPGEYRNLYANPDYQSVSEEHLAYLVSAGLLQF